MNECNSAFVISLTLKIKIMKRLLFICMLLPSFMMVAAEKPNEVNSSIRAIDLDMNALQDVMRGYVYLTDFNNDNNGVLDLFVSGLKPNLEGESFIYEYDNGYSASPTLTLPNGNMDEGDASLFDFNNDLFPDIAMVSRSGVRVYINNGNLSFTLVTLVPTGLVGASLAWVDYNGTVALYVTGLNEALLPIGSRASEIVQNLYSAQSRGIEPSVAIAAYHQDYQNANTNTKSLILAATENMMFQYDGGNTFTSVAVGSIPSTHFGKVRSGKLNGSLRDLVISGIDASDAYGQIWRNNGNGTFTQVAIGILEEMGFSNITINVFDGGLPKITLTGSSTTEILTIVYQNNGNYSFTPLDSSVTGLANLYSADIQYVEDGTGKTYVVVQGKQPGGALYGKLLSSTTGVGFAFEANLTPLAEGSVAVGFNDGRLVILQTGNAGNPPSNIPQTWLYEESCTEITVYRDSDGDDIGDSSDTITICDGDPIPAGYVLVGGDNCPVTFNPDQDDANNDGEGDACDDDDSDGDGVIDMEEYGITNPSDPCDPNFDPGYTGYDPENNIWRQGDCDGDGFLNGFEHSQGTDPYDFDDIPLSVNDNTLGSLKLWPNPTGGELNMRSDSHITLETITISNVLGQKLFWTDNVELMEILDLSEYPKGMYLIKVESSQPKAVKIYKILKN